MRFIAKIKCKEDRRRKGKREEREVAHAIFREKFAKVGGHGGDGICGDHYDWHARSVHGQR